ncbi:hypothetical protein [Streptomyces griseorubiginosus]
MRQALHLAAQPVLEPVGELVRARLPGVHDHHVASHPYLTARRPGLPGVMRGRTGDPHLTDGGRETRAVECRPHLGPDVGELLLVHVALGPNP